MTTTDRPSFVYVTYIRATPQAVWQALTDPDFTERYWSGVRAISDWKVGSPIGLWSGDRQSDTGEILESDPPRRLSYTWKVHHSGFENEAASRATFEITELAGGQVKLVLTHDDFESDSKVLAAVSIGWPAVLASLKSLLETGDALHLVLSPKEDPRGKEA